MKFNLKKISIVLVIILATVFVINTMANDVYAAGLLKVGSRGEQVAKLQKTLKGKGYYRYANITGYYGNITRDAVIKFQRDCKISADGIAGPVTLGRLYGTGSVLKNGDSGWKVTQLQQQLKKAGFFNSKVTGYYGDLTQDSVKRFQWNYGLSVDGIAGQNTLSRLNKYDGDIYWLARIIHAESSGESYSGKLAVGNVVMNRVRSGKFPNTVYGVIFEYYKGIPQFSPVANGTIYNNPSSESYRAAREAYSGNNIVGSALYFFNSGKAVGRWITSSRKFAGHIGNHTFYY